MRQAVAEVEQALLALDSVAEVEQALLALDSTAAREGDARVAVEGFAERLRATEARVRSGLASGFELEDARQTAATTPVSGSAPRPVPSGS